MRSMTMYAVGILATVVAGTGVALPNTVTCESVNFRNQECPVPDGPVALVRQLSNDDCIEGQTWGFDRNHNAIWVSRGCRAEFRVGYAGEHRRPERERGETVTCESINNRDRECAVPGGPIALIRQLSTDECIEGRTWGYDRDKNAIWVSRGCRAEFRVAEADAYRRPERERE